jgi:hypothetical protein
MPVRRILLSAVSLSLAALVLPVPVRAEDAPGSSDVEMAKNNFIGEINVNNVKVRSSPRDDAYPAMMLDKGQNVTVVGMKYKYLKVLPPEGSYAYVLKAYVNVRGDGKVGRVSHSFVAKVGSTLNPMKTAPMAELTEGQDVEILGEADEYYKIKPPQGSYLYVSESQVNPVKLVEPKPHDVIAGPNVAKPAVPIPDKTGAKPADPVPPTANSGGPLITDATKPRNVPSTTQPSEDAVPAGPVVAEVPAGPTFEHLEGDFKSANAMPITEQPIDVLLAGYTELLKSDSLSSQTRRIAEVRVSTLKLRTQAKAEFLAVRDNQQQAADRQKARIAEQEEIQQRIKEKAVTFYAAVGTLRPSSIQRGSGTLFRLTDPSSGRTIAYVRSNDSKYATLLGQFVGIKGALSTDAALNIKIVEKPTAAETVDPAKVNNSIVAQVVPPSMMPGLAGERTSTE